MASIVFGAGTSHTPMLNMTAEEWPLFEEVDRHRPHQHPDGQAATYDELLATAPASMRQEITPERHVQRHGEAMSAVDRLRDGLAGAALDAVIVVGDDHKEIYHDDNMPSMLVYRGETIANVPNRTGRSPGANVDGPRRPNWMQRAAARYYEESETRHYPVHAGLANHLIGALIEAEFDVSSANALPAGEGEGHAFGFVHRRLMTKAVPVIPVVLNTYYPPNQPSPRRCYRLGQAIREAIEGYPDDLRVGVVASARAQRQGCGRPAGPAARAAPLGQLRDPQLDLRRRGARTSRSALGDLLPGLPHAGRHGHRPVLRSLGMTS